MSFDYDRLRELVAEMEQGTAATTRYTWLDLAHELLTLRDGVEELAAWVRKVMNLNIEKPDYSAALTPVWFQIIDLLNGDTE